MIRTFETPMSPAEAADRIKDEIDRIRISYYLTPRAEGKHFVGSVSYQRFDRHGSLYLAVSSRSSRPLPRPRSLR